MAEPSEAQGIGGLAGMLEKMNAYTQMLEQEQAQKQQQEAQQSVENEQHSLRFGAFVETAYLIAAADGHVSDAETESLSRGISELTQGRFGQEEIHRMMQTAAERLQSDGRDGRIQAIASVLTDAELRKAALLVGAGVSWLDRGIGEKEGLTLQAISRAFGIPINDMHKLLAQAKQG